MTDTRTISPDSAIDRIFGPIIHPQTWINVLFLLASFPLGLLYFVVLIALLSTGLGLIPVFAGLFVLWFAMFMTDVLSELDRAAVNAMLGAAIPARAPAPPSGPGLFDKMFGAVRRRGTLKRLAYLVLRFPLGLLSFILTIVLLPLSVVLLTLPLTYSLAPVTIGTSRVETFDEAIYLCCFGAVFTLVSVHTLNSLANFSRRFARAMLTP